MILFSVVTQGAIFSLLPYNDRVQTFELQGVHVLEALERSVSEYWNYSPFKAPWVLQVSGKGNVILKQLYYVRENNGRTLFTMTSLDSRNSLQSFGIQEVITVLYNYLIIKNKTITTVVVLFKIYIEILY